MPGFVAALRSRWLYTAIGAAAAGIMLWMYGPFLGALEGKMPRALALFCLAMVWVVVNLLIEQARRKTEQTLTAGVSTAPGPNANAAAKVEEAGELRNRLGEAMALLRKARGTRGYVYEQPWYVIIGPPAAGKTTALLNAGLRFPLADALGQTKIQGVGGTRLCDWWFADEAVLIDTAGRYTTQDSDAAVDKAGWDSFLGLLRRTRPRQPLNGAIVAMSLQDVAQTAPEERSAHARAIRRRLKELHERLGVRIPVYVMLTKADLVAGFTEFFGDMMRENRAQVWGMTFPLPQKSASNPAGSIGSFVAEFRLLVQQAAARVLDRLQEERAPDRRPAIVDFPTQLATFETALEAFLHEAFGGTRLDPAPFLRGVYLVSGTQEGNPIDRLAGILARNFGIDQNRSDMLRPTQGRSYFIENLLKTVIFGEAMLVVSNPAAARRRRWLRAGAWGTALALVVAGCGALWFGFDRGETELTQFQASSKAYQTALAATRLDPVPLDAADLPRVVALLDQARALPFRQHDDGGGASLFGLSQRDKLATAANQAYRTALELILLPRLISTVEAQLRARETDLGALYLATRVYMVLGGKAPSDPAAVRSWMADAWAARYAGPSLVPFRARLLAHLDALLAAPIYATVPLNPELLDRSRALVSQVTPAGRAYAQIRQSGAVAALQPWVPAARIGPLALRRFTRPSGRTLADPIPGLFTAAGFQGVFLPALPDATRRAIEDTARLDPTMDLSDVVRVQGVEREVLAFYARDFTAAWDDLLNDIDIVLPDDAASATTDYKVLASAQSPIRVVLSAVVAQLRLTAPLTPSQPGSASNAAPAATSPAPGQMIEDHYTDLIEFVGPGPRAGLDAVLATLDALQQQIGTQWAANAAAGVAAAPLGQDAARAVLAAAEQAPAPLAKWLKTLARRGGDVRNAAERKTIVDAYNAAGGPQPLCQQLSTRFPFRPGARDDAPLADFASLFGPTGRLDTFVGQYLRPFIDVAGKDWRVHDAGGIPAPVSDAAVASLQRGAELRETFFTAGQQVQLQFALQPISLDPGAKQVDLDLGGIAVSYTSGGSTSPSILDWPGPTRMSSARVTFDPPPLSGAALEQNGPWALFRLVAQGRLEATRNPSVQIVTFTQGERQATFRLSVATRRSPFAPDLFKGFQCPAIRP